MHKMSLSYNFVVALLSNYCMCLEIQLFIIFCFCFIPVMQSGFPLFSYYGLQKETVKT